ncbi:MAG TPA: prenyltransferase/squalene oxidase repeat-containing protein [Polyangia bacterium]|nr:prenyltransferase/squalene oxidase repeat-containing protein [Polyangia bacterium]
MTPDANAAAQRAAARDSRDSLERAIDHLISLQYPTGHWEAEMVWNSMLLSQYVLVRRITGRWPIEESARQRIIQHYRVTRRADGSWAMHGEGGGYVFMTALAYVALRLLGLAPDHELVAPARRWLRDNGGVLAIPSWGKFWLSMVGLYGYEGVNPIPPEIFLLPDSLPIHPNNFYNHTRYIYLGIGYLYGKRFRADLGPITAELRAELYDQPFDSIDFNAHRHDIAATDLFVRPSLPLRLAYDALIVHERAPVKPLRKLALAHCLKRILYEQAASRGQGLSPVNGLLNCLAIYSEDPNHFALQPSLDAMESWKWDDAQEGIRYAGAHSTAWDTAFAMRAILASPDPRRAAPSLARAYAWLRATQMQEELPEHEAERRDPILGGWCFSDGQHRWPVSDCTAEALSAILELHASPIAAAIPAGERFSDERLRQAAEFILRRQNGDGGFGSYERRRGAAFLEWINPSEMYGNCMTERSYTECTASCVGALARYRAAYATTALRAQLDEAIARGVALLRTRQRSDGSYAGFWGVNFTYGIFHVVEALKAAGVPPSDPAIARAAEWLLVKQKADGGWGEHWKSCLSDEYVEHPESQAAMTAWALLALLEVLDARSPQLQRAVACLRNLQRAGGAWPRQSQSGVFFSTALLDYRLYKDYFPTWALARHARLLQS